MWKVARLVVGLCQSGIRNNVLRGLDLKRNSRWGPLSQGVMPILSLQKCVAQPKENLLSFAQRSIFLAATQYQWLKPVSRLSTPSHNTVIMNLSSQKWWTRAMNLSLKLDSHHLETKERLLKLLQAGVCEETSSLSMSSSTCTSSLHRKWVIRQ